MGTKGLRLFLVRFGPAALVSRWFIAGDIDADPLVILAVAKAISCLFFCCFGKGLCFWEE